MPKNNKPFLSAPFIAMVSPFHIEVDKSARGFSLSCNGVKGISEFSEDKVVLRLHGFSLEICGKSLYVTVFEGNSVEVVGKFFDVRFLYGKS